MECIFCAIVEGKASAHVVFEDEQTLAFMDINPINPGHTLVIPKRHVRDIYELDQETASAVMKTTVRAAKAIKEALRPDGINLLQSNERAAGQVVPHFHIHVLPRWYGDGLRFARPLRARKTIPIKEAAAKIRTHIGRPPA